MKPQNPERRLVLFETAIGWCGLVWNARGVAGFQLPESGAEATRARLLRRFPEAVEDAPPTEIQALIGRVQALLRGEASDLSDVPLDLEGVPEFNRRVYDIARAIPPGETLTYGEIARRLGGGPETARDVGKAMGQNPIAVIMPCHRVVAAGGKTGGFSARGGVTTKLRLLAIEAVHAKSDLPLFS
jgi:methylated-DNA-[protein]-cysteine S-methyltransferase